MTVFHPLGLSDHEILFFQHFWPANELVIVLPSSIEGLLAVRCPDVRCVTLPRLNPWGRSNDIYDGEVRQNDDGSSTLWMHLQCGDEALIEMNGAADKFRIDVIADAAFCQAPLRLHNRQAFLLLAASKLIEFETARLQQPT
jgi:hypothetical protein